MIIIRCCLLNLESFEKISGRIWGTGSRVNPPAPACQGHQGCLIRYCARFNKYRSCFSYQAICCYALMRFESDNAQGPTRCEEGGRRRGIRVDVERGHHTCDAQPLLETGVLGWAGASDGGSRTSCEVGLGLSKGYPKHLFANLEN